MSTDKDIGGDGGKKAEKRRGCSLAVRHWSHKPMVRGSNLALAASFHPWERCFTAISSPHPGVKGVPDLKGSERTVLCLRVVL